MARIGNILIIISFAALAWGNQDLKIEALLSASAGSLGQPLDFSIQVTSSNPIETQGPTLPNFKDFTVIGSAVSQSTRSGSNFENVYIIRYIYQLAPKTVGSLTLPSIKIEANGQVLVTRPLKYQVSQAASGQSAPTYQNSDDELEDIFNQMLNRHGLKLGPDEAMEPGNQDLAGPQPKDYNSNDAFFIYLDLSKRSVFVGEPILASWYLYSKGQILSLDRLKFPDLKGFWKEIIEEVPALQFHSQVLNGVPYRRALLASHALFPIKAGPTVIDAYKVKATIQIPRAGLGGFALTEPYQFQRSSEEAAITVKPLPEIGQPASFSGAVGQFEVTANLENTKININQPFALKVRMEGVGNAKLIELPQIKWPEGIEYYDQKSEARYFKNGRSYRQFDILLIPKAPGLIEIPSLAFSFFDPIAEVYYTKQTEPFQIQVQGQLLPEVISSEAKTEELQPDKADKHRKVTLLPPLQEQVKSMDYPYWQLLLPLISWSISFFVVIGFFIFEFRSNQKQKVWRVYYLYKIKQAKKLMKKDEIKKLAVHLSESLAKLLNSISVGNDQDPVVTFAESLKGVHPSFITAYGDECIKYYQLLQTLAYHPDPEPGDGQNMVQQFQFFAEPILQQIEGDE